MDIENVNLTDLGTKPGFIPPEELRAHETINKSRLSEIADEIVRKGFVDYPVLVDENFNVILDGHHRAAALRRLKVDKVPVVCIDYFDNSVVKVEPRPNCPIEPLTKEAILRMGLSDDVFPPKSTRHVLQFPEQRVDYPLGKLNPSNRDC